MEESKDSIDRIFGNVQKFIEDLSNKSQLDSEKSDSDKPNAKLVDISKVTDTDRPTASSEEPNEEISRLKKEVKELFQMLKEVERIKEEMTELNYFMTKKEKEWLEEKRKMLGRIRIMEEEMEKAKSKKSEEVSCQQNETRMVRLEEAVMRLKESEEELRRLRRKNLVISNMPASCTNRVEDKVLSLFQDVLHVKVRPVEVQIIARHRDGGNMVLVRMRDLKDKLEVMRWKHKLRVLDREIFMDDLTKEERKIQQQVRKRVKEEKEKGNDWKIGHGKVCVSGQWIPWESVV